MSLVYERDIVSLRFFDVQLSLTLHGHTYTSMVVVWCHNSPPHKRSSLKQVVVQSAIHFSIFYGKRFKPRNGYSQCIATEFQFLHTISLRILILEKSKLQTRVYSKPSKNSFHRCLLNKKLINLLFDYISIKISTYTFSHHWYSYSIVFSISNIAKSL